MKVAIVDYGSGNLHSAHKAFERAAREAGLAREVMVTSNPEAVAAADHIVLPGVGAFADCRRGLAAVPGMEEALRQVVVRDGRPFQHLRAVQGEPPPEKPRSRRKGTRGAPTGASR